MRLRPALTNEPYYKICKKLLRVIQWDSWNVRNATANDFFAFTDYSNTRVVNMEAIEFEGDTTAAWIQTRERMCDIRTGRGFQSSFNSCEDSH